ncbi:uncharacterized protein LOC8266970 isoform X1 [Ricinus communis]|uniref:uncharacterized protein LOC8266970 isoform X1 n=2 Tax=Ricinus communis TaxID=3988 RepID=UPI00201A579E|nr:uncharacterized protein LOC8266970 isoform X1 [Ricinus communis]
MSEEGPKLYTNKPKKAQIKQFQEQQPSTTRTTPSSASAAAASYKMGSQSTAPPPPPPPPQPPKESFARRYKFLWPLLLTVNLTVGAYLFMRTKKKETGLEEEAAKNVPPTPVSSTSTASAAVTEKPISLPAVPEPVKLREPVSENQQRELYRWMLEEKRKVKPKNPEEKKRIDEEKAILKQFIRAKSIPSI